MELKDLFHALYNTDLKRFIEGLETPELANRITETQVVTIPGSTNTLNKSLVFEVIRRGPPEFLSPLVDRFPDLLMLVDDERRKPLDQAIAKLVFSPVTFLENILTLDIIKRHIVQTVTPRLLALLSEQYRTGALDSEELDQSLREFVLSFVAEVDSHAFVNDRLIPSITAATLGDIGFQAEASSLASYNPLSDFEGYARHFYIEFCRLGNYSSLAQLNTRGLAALCASRHPAALRLLLKHPGIDVNQTCSLTIQTDLYLWPGMNALHRAVILGQVRFLEDLLAHPHINYKVVDALGNLPIAYFAHRPSPNQIEIFQLLVDYLDFELSDTIDNVVDHRLYEKLILGHGVHGRPKVMSNFTQDACLKTYTIAMHNEANSLMPYWLGLDVSLIQSLDDYFISLGPNYLKPGFYCAQAIDTRESYLKEFASARALILEANQFKRELIINHEWMKTTEGDSSLAQIISNYDYYQDNLSIRIQRYQSRSLTIGKLAEAILRDAPIDCEYTPAKLFELSKTYAHKLKKSSSQPRHASPNSPKLKS